MFYVYFLKSEKDGNLYVGKTNNIKRRLIEHNSGNVLSTKSKRPFALLGYDAFETEEEALKMEKEFKKGYKREELKN